MITRPKMSRNEWKLTEIRAFKVENFAPFCGPEGHGEHRPKDRAVQRQEKGIDHILHDPKTGPSETTVHEEGPRVHDVGLDEQAPDRSFPHKSKTTRTAPVHYHAVSGNLRAEKAAELACVRILFP